MSIVRPHAALMALWLTCLGSLAADASPHELLIVFHDQSRVGSVFENNQLGQIKELAQTAGLAVRVLNTANGVPGEVTTTPLLLFQNHRGRSVFQGPLASTSRINSFIRTARAVDHQSDVFQLQSVPIWRAGRAQIAAILKFARPTGTVPEHFDYSVFQTSAKSAVLNAFEKFAPAAQAQLTESDRRYYFDFNPWRSDGGQLYLSVEVYSQFHCKRPVFSTGDSPLIGTWDNYNDLFAEAARMSERELIKLTSDPDSAEAFQSVGAEVAAKSWDELGLALPARPPREPKRRTGTSLPHRWTVVKEQTDPRIVFRFPPPLGAYTGEATAVNSDLSFGELNRIRQLVGSFEVPTESVTMGEKELDDAIRGEIFLNASRFPTARFTIEGVKTPGAQMAYNRPQVAMLSGPFEMKGVSQRIEARAVLQPFVSSDGQPRLRLTASFQLDLNDFKIEGADGPAPANHTLRFDVNLIYEPHN